MVIGASRTTVFTKPDFNCSSIRSRFDAIFAISNGACIVIGLPYEDDDEHEEQEMPPPRKKKKRAKKASAKKRSKKRARK